MNKILDKIEADKEVLSTLPRNNKKNIAKYVEELKKLELEYNENKEAIFNEMKKRYEKIIAKRSKTDEIEKLKTEIKDIENMLEIIDNTRTSYEKMEMDKKIYKLGRFYKENLENINDEILSCINKFKEVGVELTQEDFDYSIYTKEYMITFFEESKKGNVNSDIIKDKFEEIYWKCPDIIIHIELNLRYIYLQKQHIVDKYFEKVRNQLLSTINMKPEEIEKRYVSTNKQLINKIYSDRDLIISKFLSGELNVKDYTDEKIKENYLKFFSKNLLDEMDTKEVNENIVKFINTLYEYKNYMKFQFIFKDIKKKFTEKEQHKNDYNIIKKDIVAKEKKVKSLNKKINGKGLFGKKKEKVEKQSAEYNKLILEIKADYKKLDEAEVYTKIIEKLTDNSTIYDVLKFAIAFNVYLTNCIIEENPTIEPEEIDILINELKNFLQNPYNIIIKNITILDEKDIEIIISDRYKLLGFNINKEDISEQNVDNLVAILTNLEIKYNMNISNIKYEDIEFMCEFKKILDKVEK